jgi:hypothetical protein
MRQVYVTVHGISGHFPWSSLARRLILTLP